MGTFQATQKSHLDFNHTKQAALSSYLSRSQLEHLPHNIFGDNAVPVQKLASATCLHGLLAPWAGCLSTAFLIAAHARRWLPAWCG